MTINYNRLYSLDCLNKVEPNSYEESRQLYDFTVYCINRYENKYDEDIVQESIERIKQFEAINGPISKLGSKVQFMGLFVDQFNKLNKD